MVRRGEASLAGVSMPAVYEHFVRDPPGLLIALWRLIDERQVKALSRPRSSGRPVG
jgi:hypothetical protein